MPSRMRRFRRTLANQNVGLPADTSKRAGAAPAGSDPAIVRYGSPGRCSGQISASEPRVPVVVLLASALDAAYGSTDRVAGAPLREAGVTVTAIRFSA